ncbi:MAG: hypothetical protein HY923_02375 [Elusimicrobia bacterium]|nr:hypothetical protein [Elusimicrobiota bacterium]
MKAAATDRRDILLIAGLVVLTRLPDVFSHYHDWDEAGMMSQAWAMTRGQVLYRDIFQYHPVLNFAVFVPFFALLKTSAVPHAVKAFNAALVLGGAELVRRLVARWEAGRDAALAAALLFVWLLGREWALSSYGEFYTMFPILLSAYLLQAKKPAWLAVGALWGMAFFLKQVAVYDAVALTLGFLLWRRPSAVARIAAGGLAVTAAVAAYFAAHGALAVAFDSMIASALAYRAISVSPLLRVALFAKLILGPALRDFAACWLLAAAALFATGRRAVPLQNPLKPCALWLAVNLFGVWSIGKMQLHYVLVLVPPACLLAGLILSSAPEVFRASARQALAAVLIASSAWSVWPQLRALSRERWLDPRARGSMALAETIRANTRDDDRIFLFGISNIDVFYLSERLAANGVYLYLTMELPVLHTAEKVELERKRFRDNPPALLVANNEPGFRDASPGLREFIASQLRERYKLVATIGVADLYRLK